jgi:hypothetical protein
VRFDLAARRKSADLIWSSEFNFGPEVFQLELQLAIGHVDKSLVPHGPGTRSIETISSGVRLVGDPSQIVVDG